jgi:16S rRNA (cytosine967-C5)-methyltransferase
VVAVDSSKTRLARLAENLARLGLQAALVNADAASWTPRELFDAVLLDAPCSSTGTIRRHPDIPYLKSTKDVAALAALQTRLLDGGAQLVKPGGRLVYSTCSLEPEEGEAQIAAFLVRNEAFGIDPIAPSEVFGQTAWIEPSGCLRTFPDDMKLETPEWSGMDGFFATRLVRTG